MRLPSLLTVYAASNLVFSHRIQNPLYGIPRAELMKQVEEFVIEKGLEEHLDLFRKGALLAQNPKDFQEDYIGLDEDQKEVITRETTRS